MGNSFAPDLTGEAAGEDNRHAPIVAEVPTLPDLRTDLDLPNGWLPEGAAVVVFARQIPGCAEWEALAPEFSIAGMGNSAEGALVNVLELLADYLCLCAREGKTFQQSYRGISRRTGFPLMREAIAAFARAKLAERRRRTRPRDQERYRIPLRPISAH
jgi:hypothetical protein